MTDARLAHGAKIQLGDGADPEVFAEIGEVGDFSDGDTTDLVDVTNHQSGGFKEYIADISDRDEVSFDVNYIDTDATHNIATGLRGMLGQQKNFRIEAPGDTDGTEVTAVITAVGRSYPVQGEALKMNITLKPIGAPRTYTVV